MPPESRKLTTIGLINGVDHESWGSNERGSAARTTERVLFNGDWQELMRLDCRWGGECRVELTVSGRREDDNDVVIGWLAVLFEGTSEGTDDEDGREGGEFVAPRGRTTTHTARVNNLAEGDDYADISITVTNSKFEEEG